MMIRLVNKNINTKQEYDRIFLEREKKGVDKQDFRRWKILLKYFFGGSFIDLGCLDSQILEMAYKRFPAGSYFGIDQSPVAVEKMNKRYGSFAHYGIGDIYNLGIKDNSFDYAVMGEVIEHLEYPEKAIKEAFRILDPGGILALSTPFNEARERGAVDFERHIWSFDKKDIYNLCKLYANNIKFKIMGSQWFPKYKYHFPTLIAFAKKNNK